MQMLQLLYIKVKSLKWFDTFKNVKFKNINTSIPTTGYALLDISFRKPFTYDITEKLKPCYLLFLSCRLIFNVQINLNVLYQIEELKHESLTSAYSPVSKLRISKT